MTDSFGWVGNRAHTHHIIVQNCLKFKEIAQICMCDKCGKGLYLEKELKNIYVCINFSTKCLTFGVKIILFA